MKLNQELKPLFFSQYYGQRVIRYNEDRTDTNGVVSGGSLRRTAISYLELKVLDSLTEEECFYLCDALDIDRVHYMKLDGLNLTGFDIEDFADTIKAIIEDPPGGFVDCFNGKYVGHMMDYLRYRGFAVPWMGYSVHHMVQAGWIKLKFPE